MLFSVLAGLLSPAGADAYRIGPDDVLTVQVLEHPELSVEAVTVTNSGRIHLPGAGEIAVNGKTPDAVSEAITKALKATLLRPQVTVSIRQARPQQIFVLGTVDKPGVYPLKEGWHVSEALAAAGGLSGRAELTDATLNRPGQAVQKLNLAELLRNGNSAANVLLRPGDTLRLMARTVQISVAGQVQKPGTYEVPIGNGVIEAVAIAGGAGPKAALTQVTVKHANGQVVPVDLFQAMSRGKQGNDVELSEGDLVLVPEAKARVTVMGAVEKPGFIDIEDGRKLNVAQALALAGGASPDAALTRATIKRANGQIVPVDLHKIIIRGDNTGNAELSADDVVNVPQAKSRISVLGAVLKPGFVDIPDGRTLTVGEAIAVSGGPLPRAALTRATIKRADGRITPVDLYQVLVRGNHAADLPVSGDDVITLPESRGITIVGAVLKPGTYNLEEGTQPHLSEVLAQAGGLSVKPELVPQVRLNILRAGENGKTVSLDIDPVRLLDAHDTSQNVAMRDSDIVSVSVAKSEMVFITGEVKTPGAYVIQEGDSIPDLIARAGGPTDEAALRKVSLQRRTGPGLQLDVFDAIREGGAKSDVKLQEGDYVVIPKNKNMVLVMPAVQKPGYYPIPENTPLTIGKALSLAGGPKDRARLNQVVVVRQGPKGIESQVVPLGRTQGKTLGINEELRPGDLLYVPEGKQPSSVLSMVAQAIGGLGAALSILP